MARLQVYNFARKSSLEVGSTREKKGAEEKKCLKLRVAVLPGNKEMQVVRACFPNEIVSPTHKRTEGRAPCGALSLLQKDAALQGGVQQKPL